MKRGYRNFSGRRFGDLTVIKSNVIKNRNRSICLCSCGKTTSVLSYHLKKGNTKSCGCKSAKVFGKNNPTYRGYEEISGGYWSKIKDGAKRRKLKFDVSIKFAWKIFIKQKRKCKLSGIQLKFNRGFGIFDGNASLDRIDSSKGYTKRNIQWVHKDVNKLKSNFSDEELIKWCSIIHTNNI